MSKHLAMPILALFTGGLISASSILISQKGALADQRPSYCNEAGIVWEPGFELWVKVIPTGRSGRYAYLYVDGIRFDLLESGVTYKFPIEGPEGRSMRISVSVMPDLGGALVSALVRTRGGEPHSVTKHANVTRAEYVLLPELCK